MNEGGRRQTITGELGGRGADAPPRSLVILGLRPPSLEEARWDYFPKLVAAGGQRPIIVRDLGGRMPPNHVAETETETRQLNTWKPTPWKPMGNDRNRKCKKSRNPGRSRKVPGRLPGRQ